MMWFLGEMVEVVEAREENKDVKIKEGHRRTVKLFNTPSAIKTTDLSYLFAAYESLEMDQTRQNGRIGEVEKILEHFCTKWGYPGNVSQSGAAMEMDPAHLSRGNGNIGNGVRPQYAKATNNITNQQQQHGGAPYARGPREP
ncbi:hypothetical protein HK101_010296 [Irineochytrium annulatum]|nr:hypothetical protein HK101_010296 [Irineochytrium annulatum]